MSKNYCLFLKRSFFQFSFLALISSFSYVTVLAQSPARLLPIADALVRNGSYAMINYGKDSFLVVKNSSSNGYTRSSYLKFSLDSLGSIGSAKLRVYGRNTDNASSVNISTYGVDNDTWTEGGITWNNAPVASTTVLSSASVNDQNLYYEFDVTNYVKTQLAGDKVVSFVIKDPNNQNKNLAFNSKENLQNKPELITTAANDTIPPVVTVVFNDTSGGSNSYNDKVKITINSSDQGGSGLISVAYSLNGATYKTYDSSFTINTTGSYTIKARAVDGNGNVSVTNDITFNIAAPTRTITAIADASIRNGSYAAINYGNDTSLNVKGSASSGYARSSYLKFSLDSVAKVSSAKLRLYGRNADNSSGINISAFGVNDDTWTESGITFNNAPVASSALTSISVSNISQYYEMDVTDYVKAQFTGDKVVSFIVKDISNQNKNLVFNSKENSSNPPQLIVGKSDDTLAKSNALLFIENPDKFPSNDYFVFSTMQIPWTRDSIYTVNHDSSRIRIRNNGISSLTVKNLMLSSSDRWKIDNINGTMYNQETSLPLIITAGTYKDVIIKFIAVDQASRSKVLHDSLTIVSNDDKFPSKIAFLNGLWQKQGEGLNEPSAQEIINAFGFKTSTGFGSTDPDKGDSSKLKGSEVRPSYFVSADTSRPVSVTQLAAYHGCCNTNPEKIVWYPKGSSSTLTTLFTHILVDGQTVLPRKNKPNTPADATFNPTSAFGFKVGSRNFTDASLNPAGKIGIKVWRALDANGNVMPNSYIISNDYLGTASTNYDYQDNMYFVKNVKPATGTAFYSTLNAAPSALDFGENLLQSTNSLTLNLSSLGKMYADSSKDPAITISSVSITGDNKSEFSASLPGKTILNPQDSTTLTVNFNPSSQGLKIADLLIYYKNSQSPLRVPLYGIAKASGVTVTSDYRVNSGSSTAITINGKIWSADNQYSFDNLEPYTNPKLKQIAGTDEDSLYLKEQSSNGDKKPFRYEFPVANGDYVVRLHFAELYWGAPGAGVAGGAGSRIMNVSLENQLRLPNFDVSQEVGGATALIKNIPVTVSDGKLNINFSANVNRPMIVAVEVYSFHASASRPIANINQNAVSFKDNSKKVRVYPNPVGQTLHIQFPSGYSGNSNLQIIDITGRKYEIGKINLSEVSNTLEINISALSLKSGFYYLKIISEKRPSEVIKLIVK